MVGRIRSIVSNETDDAFDAPASEEQIPGKDESGAEKVTRAFPRRWYVMRDLKRPNAKTPAYRMLAEKSFEVFTPMKSRIIVRLGKKIREEIPFIRDLLFVHSERQALDVEVENVPTLQYRFQRGGGYREPMVVRDEDMDRFIAAVRSVEIPHYYSFEEITPDMIGRKVRIIGGPLDGYEAHLAKIRGARKKRIFVRLQHLIAVCVEVEPEYVQLV